jgi:hypothetical protein
VNTPTILVRKLDQNHDPVYGNGRQDFFADINAVAQLIDTSLLLLQGEWWADLAVGFPLFQRILGVYGVGNNPQIAALLIQQTILAVPYVTGMANIDFSYDSLTRSFSYSCVVYTQFGMVQTEFRPGSSATIPIG